MLYCHHVGAVADALADEKEKQEMKIVVITGSPRKGATEGMADAFQVMAVAPRWCAHAEKMVGNGPL